MKRNARKAFTALKKLGVTVFVHDDPENMWNAEFIISGEHGDKNGMLWCDYWQEYRRENLDEKTGKILNSFGIATEIHDILKKNDMMAEWIDGGTVGAYLN